LDELLSIVYTVATPAACGFASNTPSISVPASSGSYTFTLSTAFGCQWSAVSQSPWISIESSSTSGTGSASITFDFQSLTGNIPRSGTIQVGNGSNTVTVTVNQSSSSGCTYSLLTNPTSFVLTQRASDGTWSGTGSVTTQTGCAWSASSNRSWLTFQNGSGTGTGSFTFTAVPNCTSGAWAVDTAVINVMGQTVALQQTQGHPLLNPCAF
jgi:Viral BACON domain